MKPQAVYDTNVIISAILKAGSIPASLVSLAMRGKSSSFFRLRYWQNIQKL